MTTGWWALFCVAVLALCVAVSVLDDWRRRRKLKRAQFEAARIRAEFFEHADNVMNREFAEPRGTDGEGKRDRES